MHTALSTAVLGVATAVAAPAQTVWTVDNAHSSVKFTVTHLLISEVEGKFTLYTGSVTTDGDSFDDATIEFSVDVASVSTDNAMRDKHLQSDDFFNAEKFPRMMFTSTAWKRIGEHQYSLEGDLTIRDVTKRVVFDVVHGGTVVDGWGNTKAGFKATTVINRFDYGLRWNSMTEAGGVTVGKDVTISLNVQLAQQKSS
jgi:polyisoprenoid-binding protein YceI